MFMGYRCAPGGGLPSLGNNFDNLRCMDLVDREECSTTWKKGLGTRCISAVYILPDVGASGAEAAITTDAAKEGDEVAAA